MNQARRRFNRVAAGVAALVAAPRLMAQAEAAADYPSRPIHLIIPFAPGGGTDIVARTVAQKLGDVLRQPVVPENRAGGNGTIGANAVAHSPPDGYWLTMITASHSVNVTLQGTKHPYDLLKDFAPISQLTTQPYLLVVNPSLPAKSVKELIALAKSRPGQIVYASSGNGTILHLAGETFKSMAGVDMIHVPYKGSAQAVQALLAGEVALTFSTMPPALPQVKAGKLRALGVTTLKRNAAAPEVPTISEAGLKGFDVVLYSGVLGPAGMPAAVVNKLNGELAKARPGTLNYASGGLGTGIHMAGALFNVAAGTNITHVPYKGAAPAAWLKT